MRPLMVGVGVLCPSGANEGWAIRFHWMRDAQSRVASPVATGLRRVGAGRGGEG